MSPGVTGNNFKVGTIYVFYKYHVLLLNCVLPYYILQYNHNYFVIDIFGYFKRLDTIT